MICMSDWKNNSSEAAGAHVSIMPDTFAKWVLLALAALDVLADGVWAFTTAVGADHLSTADLITFGAL